MNVLESVAEEMKGEVGMFPNENQSKITFMNLSKNIKSICCNPA